jgi:hypothetical protein
MHSRVRLVDAANTSHSGCAANAAGPPKTRSCKRGREARGAKDWPDVGWHASVSRRVSRSPIRAAILQSGDKALTRSHQVYRLTAANVARAHPEAAGPYGDALMIRLHTRTARRQQLVWVNHQYPLTYSTGRLGGASCHPSTRVVVSNIYDQICS